MFGTGPSAYVELRERRRAAAAERGARAARRAFGSVRRWSGRAARCAARSTTWGPPLGSDRR